MTMYEIHAMQDDDEMLIQWWDVEMEHLHELENSYLIHFELMAE